MEEWLWGVASGIATVIEAIAVLVVALGCAQAAFGLAGVLIRPATTHGERKAIWRNFGMWLLLGLEFELAADIVRSVVSPSWQDVGQLAAIAVVRTFLNYFLEQDLERAESRSEALREAVARGEGGRA
jgi:uncharacterized membrane protein